MSVELLKTFFDWAAVVLVGITFIAGAGALITGRILNDRQVSQLRRMDTDLTHAKTDLAKAQKDASEAQAGNTQFGIKLAEAEATTERRETELTIEQRKTAEAQTAETKAQLALEQFMNVLGKSVNSRLIDYKKFASLLRGQPKGSAAIWYEPDSEESHVFAVQLSNALGRGGIGWDVEIKPFPTRRRSDLEDTPQVFETLRRTADLEGMAVAAKDISLSNSQLSALRNAIQHGTGGWGISGLEQFFGDSTLPDKHFVIAVGPHQPNVPLVEFDHPKK